MKNPKIQKFNYILTFFILLNFQNSNAQLGDLLKKAKELKNTTKEINRTVKEVKNVSKEITKTKNEIFNTKVKTINTKNKIDLSFDTIFNNKAYKNVTISAKDEKDFYKVSEDFYIDIKDIKKKYPKNYKPYWNLINNLAEINFDKYNQLQNLNGKDKAVFSIVDVNGKAFLKMQGFHHPCYCAGRLVNENNKVVITKKPQSFFIDDLYTFEEDYDYTSRKKITKITNKPCANLTNSFYDQGGWRIKLNLSRDDVGNLIVSSVVESLVSNEKIISKNGNNIGRRWTTKDFLIENRLSPEKADVLVAQHKQDSIKILENRLKELEMERLFELEIKNSYSNVSKKQSEYSNYSSNINCLKRETGQRYVTHYDTFKRWEPDYGSSDKGANQVWEVQSTQILVDFEGLKNTCEKTVLIKGITKLQSPKGTIYYEDESFFLEPEEITEELIEIENDYNPKTAEIYSTHYYKNKLK